MSDDSPSTGTDHRAVLFDMDGVLVDSERYWVELEREILPAAVEEPVDPAEITGMNVCDLYDYLRERYEVRESREAFVERYDEAARRVYGESVALLPGFESLAAALADAFDAVVSADHVERGKPAPDVYELAVDRLGVDAGEAVAVEDSTHGVAAATGAGCSCIGYAARDSAGLSEADRGVDTPAGLRRAVREAVGLGT